MFEWIYNFIETVFIPLTWGLTLAGIVVFLCVFCFSTVLLGFGVLKEDRKKVKWGLMGILLSLPILLGGNYLALMILGIIFFILMIGFLFLICKGVQIMMKDEDPQKIRKKP